MKKINLIERLWTDSHEKQSPQRFARYAAMLIMLLTLGVGQMWADNTSDGTARLFFNMGAVNWWIADSGNKNFAYFYNNTTKKNAWSAHSVQQDGNYYYVVVPAGTWEGVILTRNNTTTSPSWENKWNKTGDITWTSGKNYISAFSENSTTATLSTYQLTSTASLSASSTSITTAQTSTLTPSLTSNTDYNAIKSTSYSVTTNPGSAGSMSGNVFSATAAGTYTVTATVTYNAKGFSDITSTTTATKDITVTAASTATLTYHENFRTETGNGTGSAPDEEVYAINATATVAGQNTMSWSYYTFSGWNTSQYITGDHYDEDDEFEITEDMDLYATWTRSIPMENEDATTNVSTTVYGTYNSTALTTHTNPAKTGYTFGGWWTQVAGGGNYVISPEHVLQASKTNWTDGSGRFIRPSTSTSSLYAKWTQDITLNANTSNHGSGSNTTAAVTYKNTALTSITHCTPAAGYKVEGYYTAATDGTKILNADGTFAGSNITVSGDVYIASSQWKHAGATTLYAHYEPKTTVRLYYSNPEGWETIYAYVWNSSNTSDKNHGWHGEDITSNTLVRNGDTYYYYEYYKEDHPNWDRVIFNDNGSNQTNNITFSNTTNNGQYNDAGKSEVGSWHDMPAEETVYSVTFYAGNRGAISAKGTAVAKNGNASVNIGATPRALTVTSVDNGYSFDYWETSGSVTVADIYSESTTVSASGTGTVTAHYLANSGWYLHGNVDGATDWCAKDYWPHRWPIDRPYRGVSGVYYRKISSINNGAYFGIHDGSNKYSGNNSKADYSWNGSFHDLVVNTGYCFQASTAFSDKWVVINTSSSPKKIWIQSPTTYYTVTVSSEHGTVTLKEKSYGGLETVKFASGETIRVEIDTVAHYSIASVYLGATAVSMSKSGTKYVGDAVMPGSNATLTVNYTPWYQVKLAASPAAAADAPTAAKTTGGATVNHNDYVISGTSVTFTKQSANGGYTWDHWENNGSGSETGNTYVATISATTTVTAVYTENDYTVTVQSSDATYGGTVADDEIDGHVDTKVTLPTATAKLGYYFTGWEITSGTATLTNASSATAAQIHGMTAAVTVRANFASIWALVGTMNSWNANTNRLGNYSTVYTKDYGYVEVDLAANTEYSFKIKNVQTSAFYKPTSSNTQITYANKATEQGMNNTADGDPNQTIMTAGKGTYRFTWNATDHSIKVTYPDSYTVTFGQGVGNGTAVTATVEDATAITSGQYAAAGKDITFTQSEATGYTFKGWYNASSGGTAISCMSTSDNVYDNIAGNIAVYAQYDPITYTGGKLDKKEGDEDGSYSVTYYTTSFASKTAPTRTGYNVAGYYKETERTTLIADASGNLQKSTTYTDASNRWTYTSDIPDLFTQWTAKTYSIKLDMNGSYDSDGSATATYDSNELTSITAPTRTGYHVEGYYSDDDCTDKVADDEGALQASSEYTTAGSLWDEDANATLYTKWEPTVYTITFDVDDEDRVGEATNLQDPVTVTYNAKDFSESTVNRPYLAGYTFGGYWTAKDGDGVQITDENGHWLSSKTNYLDASGNWIKAANTTLYAKWTAKTYTVTFYPGLGTVSPTSATVTMGATYGEATGLVGGELPTPTPREGEVFTGWYSSYAGGSVVTKLTQVTTPSDHTIYARYTQKLRVYFKNTLGWDSVFVTYGAYWDSGDPSKGTGNKDKIYHKMTRQGTSDIWYDDIPDACIVTWEGRIAFNSQRLGKVGSSSNYDNFNKGQAVFRRDFDRNTRMFVPTPKDPNKFTLNAVVGEGTTYYSTDQESVGQYKNGYWVSYGDYNLKAGYSLKGEWDWTKDNHLVSTSVFTDSIYIHTIRGLEAGTEYEFKLWKLCSDNETGSVFSSTTAITSSTKDDAAIFNAADGGSNATMTTTVAGDYVFKFNFSKDGNVKLTIEYPYKANDYRVLYSWNDGSAKEHASETIHPDAGSEKTISMFVHTADDVTSNSLKIQKYDGSAWGDVTGGGIDISTVSESGVYNFIITQPAEDDPTGVLSEKYEGNYYVRTDSAAGGWDQYKVYSSSKMTVSDYSMTQTLSPAYSHYYCLYVGNYGADISYAIANDYSPNISGTMIGDDVIGDNNHLPSGHPASVRFSWNEKTNTLRRAYLKSAQGDGNKRFLVLHGSDAKVLDKDGNTIAGEGEDAEQMHANELLFSDAGNWVYEVSLQAQPGAKASLIARYNNVDRYLVGDGSTKWETILGGKGTGKYEIRGVYDFKTNRLMTAWTPDGDIEDELTDVDLMIIREKDEHGTAITFGAKGSLDAKKVIGALKFNYDEMVGRVTAWTPASRILLKYFISFPFDVNVSDVFGLNSKYGDAYVIKKYNGAKRAEKGFFLGDGTTTFWEDLTLDSVMHANEGYCVVLDNDYFNYSSDPVWDNKTSGSSIYLYFPSAENVGNIASDTKTITIPSHKCNIDRKFTDSDTGKELNHTYTDSHWNMMGVPIFNDHTGDASAEGTPGAIFTATEIDTTAAIAYFYAWEDDNEFHIRAAAGYKFKVMHSYMVQYTGDVKFTGSTPVPASVAARRMPSANENYQIEVQVLNSNEDVLNRTYVELRENACDTFALNEDVYMSPDRRAASIFTFAGEYDVAANVLSINNHIVPMGVCIRQAGTYSFSMPSNFSGTVTLIDTYADVRTNLALENYEVNLPKGTNTDRFLLEININKVPTAIDGAGAGQGSLKDGKAHKFIMNDMLYILKDGVLYDARGNRVK